MSSMMSMSFFLQ